MKKYAKGGRPMRGMDVEADIKALETLQQGDYDVGGPKQRFARGKVKRMAGGGSVGSASKRADGCAVKGKTKGRMI